MFKLVVLLACVVAVSVVEGGYLGNAYGSGYGNGYGYGDYGYGGYGYSGVPQAVSYQSNVAIHTNQVARPVAASHGSYAANPWAYGNGYQGYNLGYGSNLGYGNYGYGNTYGYGNGW